MNKSQDDEYRKYLGEFMDTKHKLFDRDILYVSCGALVISFSFVNKLVDLSRVESKTFLILAWLCFAISILDCLIATHLIIIRTNKLREKVGAGDQKAQEDYWKMSNTMMRIFRIASIALIAIGISFLFIFILIN